jgi:Zn-dependent protease
MVGTRFRLFRAWGIPVYVDLSWLPMFGLMTWGLASGTFGPARPGLSDAGVWLASAATAVAFFACIVLHELGHALVGRAFGMPFRGITLFLFGGVAEMDREPPSAKAEFWMAVAGPAVSGLLAALFAAAAVLASGMDGVGAPALALRHLAWVNAAVFVFNLVPAFPLDGGRVFRAAMWGWTGDLLRATRWAATAGRTHGHLLIAFGVLVMLLDAEAVLTGLWLVLLGLFVATLARRSYEAAVVNERLGRRPVSRLMTDDPITVPPDLGLRSLVEDYVYRFHRKAFPVVTGRRIVGLVRAEAVRAIPRDDWDRHTVVDVMARDIDDLIIGPGASAARALRKMRAANSTRLLVVDAGRLVGVLSLSDLMSDLELAAPADEVEEPARPSAPRRPLVRYDAGRNGHVTVPPGRP